MSTTFIKIQEYAEGFASLNPGATVAQAYRQGYVDGYRDTHPDEELPMGAFAVTDVPLPDFNTFWRLYGKKRGRKKAEALWKRLDVSTQMKILEHVPLYVASTPDIQFRKDPCTYLNGACWNDEIIPQHQNPHHAEPELTFAEQSVGLIGKYADKIRNGRR